MDELDEYSQELMLNFLHTNFPVERLKDGRRFKRGIIIHGDFIGGPTTKGFLKPQSEIKSLFILLSSVLEDVFAFTKYEINMVVLKYLNLI